MPPCQAPRRQILYVSWSLVKYLSLEMALLFPLLRPCRVGGEHGFKILEDLGFDDVALCRVLWFKSVGSMLGQMLLEIAIASQRLSIFVGSEIIACRMMAARTSEA